MAFRSAGFTCWCPSAMTVRPAPAGSVEGPFPLPGPATFVTADNPHGRPAGDEANRAGRAALAALLDEHRLAWFPAVGGEGDHREPGALVLGLDRPSAIALGRRFQQAAVYIWAAEGLHLVACASSRAELLGYRAVVGSALAVPTLRPAGR